MSSKFPHFSGRFLVDVQAEEIEDQEELSIENDDLRGESVHADDTNDSFYPDGFDEDCDNPFVTHLKNRCERLGQSGYEVPRVDMISRWGADYKLGLPEATELAGGDDDLVQAIVNGVVPVASIPKDLLNDARLSDRQEWMRRQQSESVARSNAFANALLAELGLAHSLGEELR